MYVQDNILLRMLAQNLLTNVGEIDPRCQTSVLSSSYGTNIERYIMFIRSVQQLTAENEKYVYAAYVLLPLVRLYFVTCTAVEPAFLIFIIFA